MKALKLFVPVIAGTMITGCGSGGVGANSSGSPIHGYAIGETQQADGTKLTHRLSVGVAERSTFAFQFCSALLTPECEEVSQLRCVKNVCDLFTKRATGEFIKEEGASIKVATEDSSRMAIEFSESSPEFVGQGESIYFLLKSGSETVKSGRF